jgi:hypothetical protein
LVKRELTSPSACICNSELVKKSYVGDGTGIGERLTLHGREDCQAEMNEPVGKEANKDKDWRQPLVEYIRNGWHRGWKGWQTGPKIHADG